MKRIEKIRKAKNVSVVHERTKEEREPRKRGKLAPFLLFILFSGLIYLLFFSSALKINNIEITGYSNPGLIEDIIKNHCRKSILSDNILFFNSTLVEDAIKEDSGVRAVKIKKVLPRTVRAEITESTAVIIWDTKGESFEIDERGYVIARNNDNNLPQVTDSLNIEVALGERVASPTFIKFIKDVSDNFKPIVGVDIKQVIIYDILSDVRIKSSGSWTVYLDASRDPVSQLENLVRVLAEAKKSGHGSLEYIDMRLSDRVFYK